MLPSLLARDIQQGIQHFLITGFEPADSATVNAVLRARITTMPKTADAGIESTQER